MNGQSYQAWELRLGFTEVMGLWVYVSSAHTISLGLRAWRSISTGPPLTPALDQASKDPKLGGSAESCYLLGRFLWNAILRRTAVVFPPRGKWLQAKSLLPSHWIPACFEAPDAHAATWYSRWCRILFHEQYHTCTHTHILKRKPEIINGDPPYIL